MFESQPKSVWTKIIYHENTRVCLPKQRPLFGREPVVTLLGKRLVCSVCGRSVWPRPCMYRTRSIIIQEVLPSSGREHVYENIYAVSFSDSIFGVVLRVTLDNNIPSGVCDTFARGRVYTYTRIHTCYLLYVVVYVRRRSVRLARLVVEGTRRKYSHCARTERRHNVSLRTASGFAAGPYRLKNR